MAACHTGGGGLPIQPPPLISWHDTSACYALVCCTHTTRRSLVQTIWKRREAAILYNGEVAFTVLICSHCIVNQWDPKMVPTQPASRSPYTDRVCNCAWPAENRLILVSLGCPDESGLLFWFQNTCEKVKSDLWNRFKLQIATGHFLGAVYFRLKGIGMREGHFKEI